MAYRCYVIYGVIFSCCLCGVLAAEKGRIKKPTNRHLTKNLRSFLYRQYNDIPYLDKKITLSLKDADVRDAIALVGKSIGFSFLLDPDVRGVVTSLSFQDVPVALALRTLLHSNRPRLALINDHGLFRIVRATNAREILFELEEKDFDSAVVSLTNALWDKAQKAKVKKMWEGIIGDHYGKKGLYLVFDDTNKKVFFRGRTHHVSQLKTILQELDRQVPQVEIEARFVCAEKGFEETIGFDWSGVYNRRASSGRRNRWSLIDWALNFLPTPDKAAKNMRLPFVFGGNGGNTKRLNLLLNAAENRNEVKTILKPTVLTNDKEPAEILVGENVPIETIVEESVEGRLRNVRTANYKDIGIQLKVKPTVAPDHRSILLDVFIENSQQSDAVRTSNASYPVIRTTRSHTKVRLRNGQTTLISGLIKDIEETYTSRAPILSKLPFVGKLFQGSRKVLRDMQLLIFITPRVVC